MSQVMIMCPTRRDHRELKLLRGFEELNFLSHDYATVALEELSANEPPADVSIDDPEAEIQRVLERCVRENVEAVASSDDYPGATLASIAAKELHLPGVLPATNLLCQHKYFSRQFQQAAAPEAVPRFHLLDVRPEAGLPQGLEFPLFVKPVKSFFSVGAQRIDSAAELPPIQQRWLRAASFFRPFDILLQRYTGRAMQTQFLLAEGLLTGVQTTLDGYVYQGEVYLMGVVDSIMFPGTIAFQRFDYPSQLPGNIQSRMFDVARRVMRQLEFDNGQFNIEFMYDRETDGVHIIEINPRMSSQFGDLYEKVDGTNSYAVMLDLALGRKPQVKKRQGRHAMASSCVLRTFQNQKVLKLPSQGEIDKLLGQYPDMRVEILATEGLKLSQQMQDSVSYRYGLINIGGRDQQDILDIFDHGAKTLSFVFEPA
jgi:biotin carboxylase